MSPNPRPVYRRADLRRLLEPRSIALVGASPSSGSLGRRTLANLHAFQGEIFVVNARHASIDGRKCYAGIADLPEVPDCVVIAVGRDALEPVLAECVAAGVGAAVLYASGYAETGRAEDAAAQARISALAHASGLRIVGPNCVGVARRANALHAAFAEFSPAPTTPGVRIGLVSQSGALGLSLSQAGEHGASIGHVLSCGNACDVDVADFVAYLAEDPDCDVIALTFEGLAAPERLAEAASLAARAGKRVIACPLGVSEAGSEARRFHSGTTSGDPVALGALCAASGIVTIERIESLIETAAFFAKAGPPGRASAAILTGSGGTGVLAADAAARHGVATPQPSATTVARLRAAIPVFGAARNPCDATAQVVRNPESLLECATAMLADPAFGALVIPWGRSQPTSLVAGLRSRAQAAGKPICLVWMSQRLEGPNAEAIEVDPRIALFRSLDACFAALARWGRS